MRRRLYLATLAGATVGSIAGCSGDGGDGGDGDDGSDGDGTEDETETPDGTEAPDGTESDGGDGTDAPDDGTETATETEAAATLSELWTTDLETNTASGATYAVDATADGVLVANSSGVYSLSAEGEQRWYWAEPADFEQAGFAAVAGGGETVFAAAAREGVLAALDAGSGDVLWRRETTSERREMAAVPVGDYLATTLLEPSLAVLDGATGETVSEIDVLNPLGGVGYDGTLVVPGFEETAGYDPATGEVAWTAGDATITGGLAAAGNVVVGKGEGEIVGVDLDAGERAWTASLPEDTAFPVIGAGGDYAVVQWERPTTTLRGIALSDGSTAWEAEPDLTTIPFDPIVSDGVAVADTSEGYLAVDAATGDQLASTTVSGLSAITADAGGGVFYACSTSVTGYGL